MNSNKIKINYSIFATLIILILALSNKGFAQDKRPLFLGFQPGVTKEQFYAQDEFDINILPVIVQTSISDRIDFRVVTLLNYHFGGKSGVSDVGFQSLAPIFIKNKESLSDKSYGLYLAPIFGFGRNLINDHFTYTLGLEPGYLFPTDKRFSLSLGLQFGASFFAYDEAENIWRNHFGFKINLGWWVR